MAIFVELDDDGRPRDIPQRGKLVVVNTQPSAYIEKCRFSSRFLKAADSKDEISASIPASADDLSIAGLFIQPDVRGTNTASAVLLSKALGCYPIAIGIIHEIDLNTLHALAQTCQKVRQSLLQYRAHLVQQTLRCVNEVHDGKECKVETSTEQPWHILGASGDVVSGKVSSCARDFVNQCSRCKRVVCRNCIIKSPSITRLPLRLRRLCPKCSSAPLNSLTTQLSRHDSNAAFNSTKCASRLITDPSNNLSPSLPLNQSLEPRESIKQPASFPQLKTCSCITAGAHLCSPCGSRLIEIDTTYKRVWTWRTRYTIYLGGLGTGIGEGNEGVKCARGANCLAASDVEVEFECPSLMATTARHVPGNDVSLVPGSSSRAAIPSVGYDAPYNPSNAWNNGVLPLSEDDRTTQDLQHTATIQEPDPIDQTQAYPHDDMLPLYGKNEAGYWRQEIEGLGGVVKKKFRKRERVGATVREWEVESRGGEFLEREKSRLDRSWCAWCDCVVPALADE